MRAEVKTQPALKAMHTETWDATVRRDLREGTDLTAGPPGEAQLQENHFLRTVFQKQKKLNTLF